MALIIEGGTAKGTAKKLSKEEKQNLKSMIRYQKTLLFVALLLLLGVSLFLYQHYQKAEAEESGTRSHEMTPDIQKKIQIIQATANNPRKGLRKTLFTSTLCLSCRKDRYQKFRQAILSILQLHDTTELQDLDFLIINETPRKPVGDLYFEKLVQEFPFMEFVQKKPHERGQARSLNLILARIPDYKYWIHWEETWVAMDPFLQEAHYIMDHSTLDQLQLTNDWLDLPSARKHCILRTPRNRDVLQLEEHPNIAKNIRRNTKPKGEWPLYSLRPSINRTSFFRLCGGFDEDPAQWPWKFEWSYGNVFYQLGGTKGICEPPFVHRQPNHTSTYTTFFW